MNLQRIFRYGLRNITTIQPRIVFGSKMVCPMCQRYISILSSGRCRESKRWKEKTVLAEFGRSFSESGKKEAERPLVETKDLKRKTRRIAPVSWKSMGISLGIGSIILCGMLYQKKKKEDEREKMRRQAVGKSKIGGPWQLMCHDGKEMSQDDFLGKWLLIYFGFTHCPDICPDELEKMCKVAKLLEEDAEADSTVVPVFFTVDPERDTPERVKKYCEEFSPNLIGFTGTPAQVKKVSRTFRVYHSEGPRDEFNDYIVDHTVIMYLMDPEGQFVDYYGQNRQAEEIAPAIRLQMLKFQKGKKKGWF